MRVQQLNGAVVNVVLWIIAGLLAVAFLGAGLMKLARPPAALEASGMGWVDDVAPKPIGAVEVLGAVGLILPAALDIAPVLVPLAATGLFLLMVGAVVVHARRHELNTAAPSIVLGVSALVVAVLRFGPYSF